MLVVHMPQQFPFSGVFSTTNVADKFLFWSTTLLPGTSGDVLDQAGLLGKGSPTMRTGSEPALMLFLMLVQMAFCVVRVWTLATLKP